MNKYSVKKFYPKVVFIQEAEGNPLDILKVIVAEDRMGVYAVSFEPKNGRGHMCALEHNPMYYVGGEVVSFDRAAQIPECKLVLRRVNRELHKGLVKCKDGHYALLHEGDFVMDHEMKCVWPKQIVAQNTKGLAKAFGRSAGRS